MKFAPPTRYADGTTLAEREAVAEAVFGADVLAESYAHRSMLTTLVAAALDLTPELHAAILEARRRQKAFHHGESPQ